MGNAFGETKTLKQIIREQKRVINRSVRSIERERAKFERDEKKLIRDIKKMAKQGQMKSVKIMAKDLVRIRKHQEKFINLTAQLRAISLQMQSMASTQALTDSMKAAAKSMKSLNKQINLPELQKTMMDFARQTESMEMKQEMMSDTIEDVMDDEEDEEETDLIVGQVLDEIGINLNDQLVSAPTTVNALPETQVAEQNATDSKDQELEARLNNLRR